MDHVRRYAFGTATQVLPVPELMPFRLTRQLAGALAPYDATAVLHRPLAAALSALRDGGAILHVRPCSVFFLLPTGSRVVTVRMQASNGACCSLNLLSVQ